MFQRWILVVLAWVAIGAWPLSIRSQDAAEVRFERFAVVATPAAPLESTGGSASPEARVKAAVERRLGTGWNISGVASEVTDYDVVPPRTERSGASVGVAWQQAYDLRRERGLQSVEPLFTLPADPREDFGPQDCAVGRVESSGGSDLPEAIADPQWSLGASGANVVQAWEQFKGRKRQPGEGITIGHPDSGYRKHPEIWSSDAVTSRVLPEVGWDFVADKADPFDDLADGFLRNPGHGTRTASVIVSPPLSQRPEFARGVSGIAPEARLVPLRVARGVIQLSQSALAQAIREAAGDDRTRVKRKVDVISISLGGVPSRRLRDALMFAERRNVIVLAAAGNQVRTVVWPARYDNIVAVAASNVRSGTWKGSSRGSAVDITAPGESVWVASTNGDKSASIMDCLQTGSGTSYAVATTAGAAALWLSFHADTDRMQALRDRSAVAWAFRSLLPRSVRTPAGWPNGFGPGILDTSRLLSTPLPDPPQRPPLESAQTPCSADLETLLSIFEDAPNPRARAARLLRRSEDKVCEASEVADEVVFHYSLDDDVRRSLDALAGPVEPANSAYRDARRVLEKRDLSRRLRSVI